MKNLIIFALFSTCVLFNICSAQVGFASKVTGGGKSTPVYPKSPAELASYLQDDQPRVIIIDKEFNFIGSMGSKTGDGCRPSSNKCPAIGQDAVAIKTGWCGDDPAVQVTYDLAGYTAIQVKGDKTLKGVGANAVIKGRGLSTSASNIIIQNVHFTEINRHLIFGGDAVHIWGSDLIWIDHCKFSRVGRQFIAFEDFRGTGKGLITVSNNDFDGNTDHSASCDGHHYWTALFNSDNYKITFVGNYLHTTSGRSPKFAGDSFYHAVNNYFYDNTGHAFDTHSGFALIEGNYFEKVKIPRQSTDNQFAYAPTTLTNDCNSLIGRNCQPNKLTGSGVLVGDTKGLLSTIKGLSLVPALDADSAKAHVLKNAGVGKI